MNLIYEKKVKLQGSEFDSKRFLKPVFLLKSIQDVAEAHANQLKVGVIDLIPHGFSWVISRLHLKNLKQINSDTLFIRTWPATREGRFSCREFEFISEDGEVAVIATGSFAVINIKTRRPVIIDETIPSYPILNKRVIDDNFDPLPKLQHSEFESFFVVNSSDIDINNHVNNVVYFEWIMKSIPEYISENYELREIEIAYRAEALIDQQVVTKTEVMRGEGLVCLHQILRVDDGMELTRLITRWS